MRYDGVRFTVFNKSNSKGIVSNRFTSLCEGADGALWIGTEGSGVTRYKNANFETYTMESGLPDRNVKALRNDADNNLWVYTNRGVAQRKDNRFVESPENEFTPEQIDVVRPMRRQTGFSFFDRDGFHVFVQGKIKTYTTRDGLSSLDINSVYQDQQGTFWIKTKDKGLNRLKDGAFTLYASQDGEPRGVPNDETRITAVCEDSKGNSGSPDAGKA